MKTGCAALGRTWIGTLLLTMPAILFAGRALYADSMVINNVTYADVQVARIADGEICFTVGVSSNEIRKPLAHVNKIILTDEPAFSAAEVAHAAKQWDAATEGYEKTLRTTRKTWLKEWVALRLLESASKAGRFDAAIDAYITLAASAPEATRSVKLDMPKPDSAYLTDAIRQVNAAIESAKQEAAKEALLNLLIELHKAKNDLKGANDALTRRMELKAANPNSPEGARAAVALKLKAMGLALAAMEYDKVLQMAEKDGAAFVEPADQAEALFCIAEANAGKAQASKDPDVWKNVALAYMRVVVTSPAPSALVAGALVKTAAIHEARLGEKDTALRLYEQVASEYKDQPAGLEAQKEAKRLKGR